MADRTGEQLGNYRLTRLLGEGGFAEVYLGAHVYLETQAAIKVLQARLVTPKEIEKFRVEARTIAALDHPHIVRILDFGVDQGTPFLVMQYAPNGSLRQHLPAGVPLEPVRILPYVQQVADALQYAHDQGIIHQDVKPPNMLLGSRNEVLLGDFGIAIEALSTRRLDTGGYAGTPAYAAPEQLQGRSVPASDQYSLAVVVYEWLTGTRPFQGTVFSIVSQQFSTLPMPLRERVPTISPAVEQVVMTALSKNPGERFGSVRAFARALEQAIQIAPPLRDAPLTRLPGVSVPSGSSPAPGAPSAPAAVTPSAPTAYYATQRVPAGPAAAPPTIPAAIPAALPGGAQPTPQAGAPPITPAGPPFQAPPYVPGPITPPAAAPRKRSIGLIALLSALALIVLVGGGLVALTINGKGPFAAAPTTPPIATATPAVRFQQFSNAYFSIMYPEGWSTKSYSPGDGGPQIGIAEQFIGAGRKSLIAGNTESNDGTPDDFDTAACTSNGYTPTTRIITISLAGQSWRREECDNASNGLHILSEAVTYKGSVYYILYSSLKAAFAMNRALYFAPMEQSFTFLT